MTHQPSTPPVELGLNCFISRAGIRTPFGERSFPNWWLPAASGTITINSLLLTRIVMPTIDPAKKRVTLINTFHVVSAEEQDLLIDSLTRVTVEVMQHLPGYVAASVHKSLDGLRVLNYAQWETVEQFQAMLSNPLVHPHLGEVEKIASQIEPVLYEVAYVNERGPA